MSAHWTSKPSTTGWQPLALVGAALAALLIPIWLASSQGEGLFLGFLALFILAWVGQRLFLGFSAGPEERLFLRRRYWYAFIALIVITCLFYNLLLIVEWKGRPGFYYDDESFYDLRGQVVAENLRVGVSSSQLVAHTNGFVWVNGAIYYLFGHHPLLVRLFNALAGLCIAASTAGVAYELFPGQQRIAESTFWLIAVNPVLLVWSTSHIRDIQVAAGSALVLWTIVKLLIRGNVGLLLVGGGALWWVWYMRSLSTTVLVIAVGTGLLSLLVARRLRPRAVYGYAVSGLWVLVILLAILARYTTWMPPIQEKWAQYGQSIRLRDNPRYETFSDEFFVGEKPSPVNVAASFARSLLIPNPFWILSVGGLSSWVQFAAGLPWYLLLPFWLAGWAAVLRRGPPAAWPIYSFALGMLLSSGYSLFTGYSDPMRVRVPALGFLMLYAAYGLHLYREAGLKPRLRAFVAGVYVFEWVLGIYYFLSRVVPWSVFSPQGALVYALAIGVPTILALFGKRLEHARINR